MGKPNRQSVASFGLVVGAALGLLGAFVPSDSMRGLLWGIDGTALIVATGILTIHHLRRGNDLLAAGFLVFVAGETLILASAAMDLSVARPIFAAGAGLWAASLALVSISAVMGTWIRVVGVVSAFLFAAVAVQGFLGQALTPLSQPLPFYAYPLLVATLIGWAWEHYRNGV